MRSTPPPARSARPPSAPNKRRTPTIPDARQRRAEILLELADVLLTAKQPKGRGRRLTNNC